MTPAQLQALRLVQGIAPTYSYANNPTEWDFKEFLMEMTSRYHADISTYDSADGIESIVTEFGIDIVTLYNHRTTATSRAMLKCYWSMVYRLQDGKRLAIATIIRMV